uniref:Curved DNA-binding protein Cdb4 n=1 Tax=Rubinisphaera brasiliensis (strain ATCC 49424 / DSM 5305 / JCM 21570 / IAM 15109 / NBRC 103401 / IFAM 1448) TaxID=756272 RepID=F0SJG5_RUBBR|nr:curved DNA-binding protein Cdb4 [Rubinisphaera brasiliensis DSM 5305]
MAVAFAIVVTEEVATVEVANAVALAECAARVVQAAVPVGSPEWEVDELPVEVA